jgi:hypothetical protein
MEPEMSKPSPHPPNALPKNVALKIANLFHVPKVEREPFCDHLRNNTQRIWNRDRRATSSKSGPALRQAAEATRSLLKSFDRLRQEDRDWVNNLCAQSTLWGEGIERLDSTILNLAIVFNHAVGRSSPIPRKSLALNEKLGVKPLNVKDQMFREVVIGLMTAADENRGKFTLDSTSKTGTLIEALDLLRDHLPKGLVRYDPPAGTIQRIKKQFRELRS